MKKDKGIKFETLKKPKLIRNLVILFMITFIGSAIYFKTSSSKYQTTQVIPIINTKVVNKPWWTLNITKDGVKQTIKSSGTIENSEYIFEGYAIPEGYDIGNVTCTRRDKTEVSGDITLDKVENNKIKITDSSKKRGTICEVTIRELLNHKILADNKLQEGEPDFSKATCNNEIAIANTSNTGQYRCTDETQNGVYKSEDDFGPTYYYRGSVNNNWVKFGKNSEGQDIWWRIIRINGNGSVKLIYAGEGNSPSDVDPNYNDEKLRGYFMQQTGINKTAYTFNSSNTKSEYVGYMYTEGEVNGNEANSNAKTIIDEWYVQNLQDYEQYLDGTTGFCGDRTYSTENTGDVTNQGWTSTGKNIYYGAYLRLFSAKAPSYVCPDKTNDLYTTSNAAERGNKALTNPIGLITADEVAYAGGKKDSSNYGYWLYTRSIYWTLSPVYFNVSKGVRVFIVYHNGDLDDSNVNYSSCGLRPVVNLKAETLISQGDGTIDKPYIVKTT